MWRSKPPLTLFERVEKHLGCDPSALVIVEHEFAQYDLPNLHFALQEIVYKPNATVELLGFSGDDNSYSVKLGNIVSRRSSNGFSFAPAAYQDVELPGGMQSCVKRGLFLWQYRNHPITMLIREPNEYLPSKGIILEVMAADREIGEQALAALTQEAKKGRAFRGRVLSLDGDCFGNLNVRYHTLPSIAAADIILPASILLRIQRHTIAFTEHADRLRSLGRHLKRGLLLYGPPGTGKTLCAMYIAAQMPERTVLLITGVNVSMIETVCRLARQLQPTTIILEDVDLMGGSRETQSIDANGVLFKLLNEMDGLAEDADLLFVLTTNRPDVLEPALAARPGRIDQAIEIPLPDAICRRKLLDRYCVGLTTDGIDWERLVERIDSVSAALIRELVRRAALLATIESTNCEDPIVLQMRHFNDAADELLNSGGLPRRLLGFTTPS